MIWLAFKKYAILSVAWCVGLSANIAAIPAPNSARVELALWPRSEVDSITPFLGYVGNQVCLIDVKRIVH